MAFSFCMSLMNDSGKKLSRTVFLNPFSDAYVQFQNCLADGV